jgi:2,5-dihydroxypyridine 5,6-dioxygenase
MSESTVVAETLALFKAELELCRVHEGEVVAVLSGGSEQLHYPQAFMLAAQDLGATAFHLNISRSKPNIAGMQGKTPLSGNRAAIDALKQADLLIDLLGLLFSLEQTEIQKSGTRVLRVAEPIHVLRQMFPSKDLRRRVEFAAELLGAGREMRITSGAGTDLRYRLGQYPAIAEYGYTDEPGRWDHFPSGFAFTHGTDHEVEGIVVLMPGDIIASFKRYVQSPVKLTVREGYVVEIAGDGMDAKLLRSYMQEFSDPRAFAVSHIGWGLNERAKWHYMATGQGIGTEYVMNALSFYGNVLFSTGPNTELGGSNDTQCHLDFPMQGCSLWIDGVPILHNGDVVHPQMRLLGR